MEDEEITWDENGRTTARFWTERTQKIWTLLLHNVPARTIADTFSVPVAYVHSIRRRAERMFDWQSLPYRDTTGDMKAVADEVAEKYNVSISALVGRGRGRVVSLARHELCYRLRTENHYVLKQIGAFLQRDHSTVIHSIRKHADRHQLPLPDRYGYTHPVTTSP